MGGQMSGQASPAREPGFWVFTHSVIMSTSLGHLPAPCVLVQVKSWPTEASYSGQVYILWYFSSKVHSGRHRLVSNITWFVTQLNTSLLLPLTLQIWGILGQRNKLKPTQRELSNTGRKPTHKQRKRQSVAKSEADGFSTDVIALTLSGAHIKYFTFGNRNVPTVQKGKHRPSKSTVCSKVVHSIHMSASQVKPGIEKTKR